MNPLNLKENNSSSELIYWHYRIKNKELDQITKPHHLKISDSGTLTFVGTKIAKLLIYLP